MASNRRSDRSGGGARGFFRALIPARWRRPLTQRVQRLPAARANTDVSSLAVRPSWWRLTLHRLIGNRADTGMLGAGGGSSTVDGRGNPTAPARPLIARRAPLTSTRSVLRTPKAGPGRPHVHRPGHPLPGHAALPPSLTPGGATAPDAALTPGGERPDHAAASLASTGFAATTASTAPQPPQRGGDVGRPLLASLGRALVRQVGRMVRSDRGTSPGTRPANTVSASAAMPLPSLPSLPPRPVAAAGSVQPGPLTAPQSSRSTSPQQPGLAVQRSSTSTSGATQGIRPPTAEQRWRAAVASVPLESARPFPTGLRPLVARIAGSADRASYTTGPATRRALSEAGALGATTGSVVHLARQPSTDAASMGVLAHELSHARNPVGRPRFLLHSPGGALDADERTARSVGDEAQSVVSRGGRLPGIAVQRLGLGDLPGASNLGNAAGGLAGQASNIAGQASNMAGQASSAAGSAGSQLGAAAGAIGDRVADQASAISAGIVDALRVGGAGAGSVVDAAQAARGAVESTVRDTASSAAQEVSDVAGGLDDRAAQMMAQLDSLAGGAGSAVNQGVAAAGQAVDGAVAGAGDAISGGMQAASGALNQAQGAAGGLLNQAGGMANQASSALSAAAGAAGADLDKIAQALEERILREIERRGGRYAGVF